MVHMYGKIQLKCKKFWSQIICFNMDVLEDFHFKRRSKR